MKEIGGNFELELHKGGHYHPDALHLNTGRNCFEYILRAKGYKKVYIPYYTCEVMLEPLRKCGVKWEFYHINEDFEPLTSYSLATDEAFLYTNYWGLKQACVKRSAERYGKQLIVDNAQAFFASPIEGVDTFYSARKFFGVPDGAYLYTDKFLNVELEQDVSCQRCEHLLRRIDEGAERGYEAFRRNDDALNNQPIKKMSQLTESILMGVDYKIVVEQRRGNFNYLHSFLGKRNRLNLETLKDEKVPMIYPFFVQNIDIRKKLIANKIFVATYWPNVFSWTVADSVEHGFADYLIPLPIDQRYGEDDIERILKIINN